MKQQEHVQAQMQEVLGKLHQMEGRLQALPPTGLDIVGRAQIAEGELGAVGGNEYSSALISATAQTTSKMKSKDDVSFRICWVVFPNFCLRMKY